MSRLPPPFGPFQPIRRLGAGGMAETFVAVRRGPGRFEQTVCIKRILPAHEGDAEFVAAFLDEARTSAGLRHANIVQVLDFGLADESHYLALELVDGVDLRALFEPVRASGGPGFPPELVLLIALDLASALAHAHGPDPRRPKVAHRDISPSNVLVSKAGEIKLTDFGIARAEHHTRRTRSGVLKGKVPYMPPEYIEHTVFDARSDLFSLGVLLYELLVGRRPFDGTSDIDTVRRITKGHYPKLPRPTTDVERALHACVARLLALDPSDRFQSASALADALPEFSTHRARSRLAALVHASMHPGEPVPAPSARANNPGPTAPLDVQGSALGEARTEPYVEHDVHAAATNSYAPTRTIARRRKRSPWLFGGLASCVFAACALGWFAMRAERVNLQRPVPRPPELKLTAPLSPEPIAVTPPPAQTPEAQPPAPAAEHNAASAAEVAPTPDAAAIVADAGPRAQETRLRVVVVPYGDVWLDDAPVGSAPLGLRVSPGQHVVAVGNGKPEVRRTVRVGTEDLLVTFRRNADGSYKKSER